MPVGVLTHKNSLISKEPYNKLLDRTEAIFDSDTPMDPGPKLKKKDLCKKIELCGVPIRLLTEKNLTVIWLKTSWRIAIHFLSDF